MSDILEAVGYFIGFWLFLVNKKFRDRIIDDWRISGWLGRFFIILGALSSFFCGVILPMIIIKMILE